MNKKAIKEKLQQIQTLLGEIPGVHLAPMMNFAHGNMAVTRKGELKIPLSLPADEMLGKGEDLGAVLDGRWKMVPILMFVEE